ncbi:hypothetical protein BDA99DRAFT_494426 [Phascolomyces articulosus]|uniref:WRKY domain-containing protein n=1 Tax=Phascolomyces articulosus TaxID=60185 RepID=A0AAD5KAX1_9FUNG|nr:hypothetical protein BDA99DRAFT_494426 [Phascolomyces articulosus]
MQQHQQHLTANSKYNSISPTTNTSSSLSTSCKEGVLCEKQRRRKQSISSQSSELSVTSESTSELQDLIQQYKSQPELLKLILTSKVEEDKRRTEEAKLRIKELDLYPREKSNNNNTTSSCSSHYCQYHQQQHSASNTSSSSSISHIPKRRRSNSSLSSTSSLSSVNSSALNNDEQQTMMEHQRRRNSAAFAMVAMGTQQSPPPTLSSPLQQHTHYPSSVTSLSFSPPSSPSNSYPSPDSMYNNNTTTSTPNKDVEEDERPRKRREMQAITKIVETREFPYQDDYFWKNNGNTTQKKTGCKSIYYKCSNSNKGCPVNKTVTARPNGEYLIKYRGNHLPECGRVERVRDI